jgi:hypothetical protein
MKPDPLTCIVCGAKIPCITERKLAINDITPDSDDFSRLDLSIETGDLICIYRGENVISEQGIRQSEREKVLDELRDWSYTIMVNNCALAAMAMRDKIESLRKVE